MLYAALFFTAFWSGVSLYLIFQTRKIRYLKEVDVSPAFIPPSLTIIIAVRNEERDLAEALESICRLDYPQYRVLVVNDRSTDGTAAILHHFQTVYSHLYVHTIDSLPPGWLGKNHAMYCGYKETATEWMLFTDADVRFAPDTMKKALQYCVLENVDHLSVLPDVNSRSRFFNSIMDTFKIMLDAKLRPWEASDPKSKHSFGVGAFMLVKKSAYENAGTHRRIALRPDDDLQLGACIKSSGLRQDVLLGNTLLELEWYTSVKEFINGLTKNTFSTVDYNLGKIIVSCLFTFLLFVLPLPLLLLFGGAAERILAGVILLFQVLLFIFKRGMRGVWWYALMMPIAASIMIYIMWQSAVRTIRQGGIYWRESFYPLAELKKNTRV